LNFFLYNHYLSEYILAHKREKRNPFLKELRFEINLDEIARCASDEIKSALSLPEKRDFIAKRFHPPKVDFFRRRRI